MKKILLALFIFTALMTPVLAAHATTGTIDSTYKYAWAPYGGWINFAPTGEPGLTITDTAVTGDAWSDNFGWIYFSGPTWGVTNSAGVLSGEAWCPNSGWVYFGKSATSSTGVYYNTFTSQNVTSSVTIDSSGRLNGLAYADNIGPIYFSCVDTSVTPNGDHCVVKTTWRPISCGDGTCNGSETCSTCPTDCGACPSGGGGGSGLLLQNGPTAPVGGFKVVIDGGAVKTNSQAATLSLDGGQNSTQVEISSDSSFSGAAPEVYQSTKSFVLPSGDGQKTVYVKFIASNGVASPVISASIILDTQPPVLTVNKPKSPYKPSDDIVLSGTSDPNLQIMFSYGDQYGITTADSNGKWSTDLGKMSAGNHGIIITAEDSIGNTKTATVNINVIGAQPVNPVQSVQPTQSAQPSVSPVEPTQSVQPLQPTQSVTPVQPSQSVQPTSATSTNTPTQVSPNAIQSLINNITNIISSITPAKYNPVPIISIPKETPQALQHSWNLLPVSAQQ